MRKLLLTLMVFLGTATLLRAQVRAEHLYQFNVQGLSTPYNEKVFTELMVGFDPHLKVSHDPQQQQVRLLAYRPLNLQEVITMAAQVGVTLTPRRMPGERVDLAVE
jgi:hypothetical protein